MDADLEQALARTRNPVLVADDERRYVDANDAALAMLGLTREELIGRRIEDFVEPHRRAEIEATWQEFLARGGLTGFHRIRLDDGRDVATRFGAVAHVSPGRHLSIFVINDGRENGTLTTREREVLERVARGETTREVAAHLSLRPSTVESHVRAAIRRLGARNRAHAVALALARGELAIGA